MKQLQRDPIYVELEDNPMDFKSGLSAAEIIEQMNPRPDAIQAYSDIVALGLLSGLHRRNIRIPEDISVVGFDNRQASSLCFPPLTTVAQPNWDVGVAAAEVLLKKIRSETRPSQGWSRSISTELIVREST